MKDWKHTEINGTHFTLIPIIPFEQWCSRKYGNMDKFMSLTPKDREKVFLRWKWGHDENMDNESLESSERATLFQFKDADLSTLSEAIRFHIENKLMFDEICEYTKRRIGLIQERNPRIDKVMETFSGNFV